MAEETTEIAEPFRGRPWMLWLAGGIAVAALGSAVWLWGAWSKGVSSGGASAVPLALLIPAVLLLFAVLVAGLHVAYGRIDRLEARQRSAGRSGAVAMALRGGLAAVVVYWVQRHWIHMAFEPTGPLGETIPLAARVFALMPLSGVILLFGAATALEMLPDEKRPPWWALLLVAIGFVAVFVWSASATFSGR